MTVQMTLAPVFVLVLAMFIFAFLNARTGEGADGRAAGDSSFQLSILYCVMVALALPLRQMDLLLLLLGWVFVVLQILGGAVAFGVSGPSRFYTFAASAIVLFAMWVIFALKLLLAITI
jgi:hypothetical protein